MTVFKKALRAAVNSESLSQPSNTFSDPPKYQMEGFIHPNNEGLPFGAPKSSQPFKNRVNPRIQTSVRWFWVGDEPARSSSQRASESRVARSAFLKESSRARNESRDLTSSRCARGRDTRPNPTRPPAVLRHGSVRDHFSHWRVAVSPSAISGDTCVAGHRLFADGSQGNLEVSEEPALHLDVNIRAFRVQRLTEWVNAVLSGNAALARSIADTLADFPLAMTRDLSTARRWLRERTRGLRRSGLVASSGAIRLRAEGLELSSGFRLGNRDLYVNWFLNLPPDVRSSNQLEVAASEFDCQGLELDWVGLCWGGDLHFDMTTGTWCFGNFVGSKWQSVRSPIDREYILNTYRVLLTRAREGAIIWVPRGDVSDETRNANHFDQTAEYLSLCGLRLEA